MVTSDNGSVVEALKFYPFGSLRSISGTDVTDKKFTGQRLDGTGLYYYGARYYDPEIGRFISADTVVPRPFNPQALNRYSYVLNNPLKYNDPTGHDGDETVVGTTTIDGQTYTIYRSSDGSYRVVDNKGGSGYARDLQTLLGAARGYMAERGDYGFRGNAKTGPVVTINFQTNLRSDPIPVHYVTEDWVSSNKGQLWAAWRLSTENAIGISVDFEGGAFVRYQYYVEPNAPAAWVSTELYTVSLHECFHYYEQVLPEWRFFWCSYYITDRGWREAAEARAKFYARYPGLFYDPSQGWRSH